MGALTLCPDSPLDHWKPPQWFHLRVTSDYQKFEDLDVLFEYALADLKDGHSWQSRQTPDSQMAIEPLGFHVGNLEGHWVFASNQP